MVDNNITEHFDNIAKDYDFYKKKNEYYYSSLKKLYSQIVPPKKQILEIGCGTGSLIISLQPDRGVGIDVSGDMIKIAKKRKSDVHFMVMPAEKLSLSKKFEYVIMADVIEHLSDVGLAIKNLKKVTEDKTKIIISMANPKWEPLLMLAEKLGLKMPEGPHNRITAKKLFSILRENNFRIVEKGYRLLLPVKVPVIHHINKVFYKVPVLRKLGLIEYVIIKNEKSK